MTPHNEAAKSEFAKTVLMPGDPLRAKFIAEKYLKNARLVNNVRGIQGYTGEYKGVKVSVMASGMGMPSMGIYAHELFNFYDVENIIRVGSCGSYSEKAKLYDIIFPQTACYDSSFASQFNLPGTFSPACDFTLLLNAVEAAKSLGEDYRVGTIVSSDVFYSDNPNTVDAWRKMGVMAVDMETAALYMTAARLSKRALSILTVSDSLITKEETTPIERQISFNAMMVIALETAIRMEKI
ncbi:MAG: purine-nucleoside phosphorylase [Clostridia bacterium]